MRFSCDSFHHGVSYILQGDFIQYLMDLLGPELSKRGASVYRHTLTNVLETALNASNAKFEVRLSTIEFRMCLTYDVSFAVARSIEAAGR